METSSLRNRPDWLLPTRQLVLEITDCFTVHSHACEGDIANNFKELLRTAHKLERFVRNALQSADPDHVSVWSELRLLIKSIRGHCEVLEHALQHEAFNPMVGNLRSVSMICEQFIQQEDKHGNVSLSALQPTSSVGGTVMILDSELHSRDVLVKYVQHSGHKPAPAQSEQAMLQILCTVTIDLILLDLSLHDKNGLQLLREIKASHAWRHIPVVVISNSSEAEGVIRCIEAGAEDYLFKPLNPILLRARINAGVERKRWHDREAQFRQELERNERFIRRVFGRYLSAEIVETLLGDPDGLDLGGIQRTVTVMMADIRGFTTICEHLAPNRVVSLLNNYLGVMTDIIMKHNGTIDEFIGDAILAIFGAPISRHDDADRAIECALEMQRAMKQINLINMQEGLPHIAMGVSLNTGPVIAGNIGSEKRSKYGVVGHTVNQTARIEGECPGDTIYISKATLQHTRKIPCIEAQHIIQAKGMDKAIEVYEISGLAPAH